MEWEHWRLETYYPIFLYLAFVILFAGGVLIVTCVVPPRKRTVVKAMPYESGMDPVGDARQRFDVKFYLTAILFLVLDVELLFLYPWAVVAYHEPALIPPGLSRAVFWEILVFLVTVVVAYAYAWKKGVFRWR
jgi:NADH-quinone oxidoreductase subunit A